MVILTTYRTDILSQTTEHVSIKTTNVTELPGLTPTSHNVVLFVVIIGAIFALSVVIIGRLIVLQIRHGYKRRHNEELLELLTKKNFADIENLEKLKKTTAMLLTSDNATLQQFLSEHIGTAEEDRQVSDDTAICIPTCRYPNIRCAKLNSVQLTSASHVLLHVNKIDDYYCEPLYLATAPIPGEISHYWQLIEQENIGVILWLGKSKELNIEKFMPYIPLRTLLTEKYGEYTIKNVSYVAGTGYTVYILDVKKFACNDGNRHIVLIYAHSYPTDNMPKDVTKLSDIVTVVQLYHEQQIIQNSLNGILIHHTAGVNRSAAFAAMYIGRQMWLHQSKVNVKGILRYIRRYRHGAYTTFSDSPKQVQFVYQFMESLVKRMNGRSSVKVKLHRIVPHERHIYDDQKAGFLKLKPKTRKEGAAAAANENRQVLEKNK